MSGKPEIESIRAKHRADASALQLRRQRPDGRLPAVVLVDEERHLHLAARGDHAFAVGKFRRHRLLADDRQAVLGSEQDELFVRVVARSDVHKVQSLTAEQLRGLVVNRRDAELRGELLRLGAGAVVQGDAPGILEFAPGGELAGRPETSAEEGKAKRGFH